MTTMEQEEKVEKTMQLNTSERLAIIVLNNEENALRERVQELQASKTQVIEDIEARLGLKPGSLNTNYTINAVDDNTWFVEEVATPPAPATTSVL